MTERFADRLHQFGAAITYSHFVDDPFDYVSVPQGALYLHVLQDNLRQISNISDPGIRREKHQHAVRSAARLGVCVGLARFVPEDNWMGNRKSSMIRAQSRDAWNCNRRSSG